MSDNQSLQIILPIGDLQVAIDTSAATAFLKTSRAADSQRVIQSRLYTIITLLNSSELQAAVNTLAMYGRPKYDVIHFFRWHDLTYQDAIWLRSLLIEKYPPRHANHLLCAFKNILKACCRTELITYEQFEKITDSKRLPPIPHDSELTGRAISDEEILHLFTIFEARGSIGIRDAAILALFIGTGLSRSTISKLDMKDYNADSSQLSVYRQGQSEAQPIFLPEKAKPILQRWLGLRGDQPGPLFVQMAASQHTTGVIVPGYHRLSSHGIYCIFQLHAEKAGMEHFRLQDIRRTFVSKLFDAAVDIFTIAKVAGIKSIEQVERYNEHRERAKRAAMDHLNE